MKKHILLTKLISACAVIGMLSSCVYVIDARGDKTDESAAAPAASDGAYSASAADVVSGAAYSFLCMDETDAPVEGVLFKVCSDNLCTLVMSDTSGVASYPASDGKCEVCVMSYPDKYVLTDDQCIIASDVKVEYRFSFALSAADTTVAETTAAVNSAAVEAASGLTAEISGSNVLLKWEKSENADAYRIYMCDENGENCHSLVRTLDTDFLVDDIKTSGTYLFRIAVLKKEAGYYTEEGIIGEAKVTVSEGAAAETTVTSQMTAVSEETPAEEQTKWDTYDFAIYDENGKKMMLSEFAGKPVVINVWATWCGYCVNELPSLSSLYKKYGDEVQFIMLNCDGRGYESEVKSYVNKNGWTFPIYYDYDNNASRYYGSGIPVTAAISAQGELEVFYEGAASSSQLEAAVKSILSGRRSTVNTYGDRRIKLGETETSP